MLLRFMLTPVIGFTGLAQVHRVGSEAWHVGGVRVDLQDMWSDAEDDAVVRSWPDPAQGAGEAGVGAWALVLPPPDERIGMMTRFATEVMTRVRVS